VQSSSRSLSGQTTTTKSLAQMRPQAPKVILPHLAKWFIERMLLKEESRVEHMVLDSNLAHLA